MANDSPLAAPQRGDPITAAWASALTDAVNARGMSDPNANGTATPYGTMLPADVETTMEAPGPHAMPFDCVVATDASGDARLYCALPNVGGLVYLDGQDIGPDSSQTVGTAQNAFADLGLVVTGSARYIVLYFAQDANAGNDIKWKVAVRTSSTARPSDAIVGAPVVLLALYNIAAEISGAASVAGDTPSLKDGLVQFHRGVLHERTDERLPFRVEVREVSGAPHAVAPYAFGGSSVGFLWKQLVSYGAQNIEADANIPTATIDGRSCIDFGALTAATNFWLIVTLPTADLSDPGSWTIASQVARPVTPPSSSGLTGEGRVCILLGSWTPTGGLERTWAGGVFAFAGPVAVFSAVTKLRKSGSTLYWTLTEFDFHGGFTATRTDDERSITL